MISDWLANHVDFTLWYDFERLLRKSPKIIPEGTIEPEETRLILSVKSAHSPDSSISSFFLFGFVFCKIKVINLIELILTSSRGEFRSLKTHAIPRLSDRLPATPVGFSVASETRSCNTSRIFLSS